MNKEAIWKKLKENEKIVLISHSSFSRHETTAKNNELFYTKISLFVPA